MRDEAVSGRQTTARGAASHEWLILVDIPEPHGGFVEEFDPHGPDIVMTSSLPRAQRFASTDEARRFLDDHADRGYGLSRAFARIVETFEVCNTPARVRSSRRAHTAQAHATGGWHDGQVGVQRR